MEIEDLITPESVVARSRATSKKQVLQELGSGGIWRSIRSDARA